MFVLKIIIAYKICNAFGKKIWYVFGIVFLDVIFIPILGFGKSKCSVKAVIKPAKFKIVRVDNKDDKEAAANDADDAPAENVKKEVKPKKRVIKKENTDMFEVPKSNKPSSLNRRKSVTNSTSKKDNDETSSKKSTSKSEKSATKKTTSKPKTRKTKSSTPKKLSSSSKTQASANNSNAKKTTKSTARKKNTAKKTTKSGKSSIKVESPIDFE